MFTYNPNIYIGNLEQAAVDDAIVHAKEEFPNECCGAIINGKYIRFKNEAENTASEFLLYKNDDFDIPYMNGEVECIVHSHNDSNKASKLDQIQQRELDIPSLIINLKNRSVMDCIVFGEKNHAPLEGRPFFWGAFDCGLLVQDYIFDTFGYIIKTPPHEWGFWNKSEDCFEQYILEDKGFKEVSTSNIRKHDLLLYNIQGTRFINHVGVVMSDNGLVYHHLVNQVSGKYPISYNRKYLRQVMRYTHEG